MNIPMSLKPSDDKKRASRMKERTDEKQYADYFICWVNQAYSFDYETCQNQEENSEVDVFARSKTGRHPELKLQLATSHGEIMKVAAKNTENFKNRKDFKVGDVDFKKWLTDVINKKNELYPSELKHNLILLIHGTVPTPPHSIIESLQPFCSNFPFKGIYYLSLPVTSSDETAATKYGFIVPLKEACIC